MKQRSTTPVSGKVSFTMKACVIAATIMALTVSPFTLDRPAYADEYDAKIRALEQQISQYNSEASKLGKQRQTYENKLAKLTNERNQIQASLNKSQARAEQLGAQIAENQQKIKDNQSVLGDTIADMYIDGNISPLEMLASSNNIAEYVDKQANREQVQTTLNKTIQDIEKIKKELEKQKKEVDQVIADQKFQRKQLVQKEEEQQQLISQTKGKESAFQRLSAQSAKQKSKLEQQQQAEIAARLRANGGGGGAVAGDPGRGGYPNNLANAPQDSMVDPWGMYNRECVSYVAWKVQQKTGHMPYWGGVGNANQWPGNARGAGIGTGSTPRAKSAGVISAGAYGHIVWVESVNSDGTINISQYNEYIPGRGWGHYSERYNVNPATYDTYIYF
ncbi:MAG TPA: CHAP domain-containing protein [Candidatus Saccharimonadales bacterium]